MIPKLRPDEIVSFNLKIALLKNYLNKNVLDMWDVTVDGEWVNNSSSNFRVSLLAYVIG
jgi:hypothetical protein